MERIRKCHGSFQIAALQIAGGSGAFGCAMRALHLPIADPCHEDWDAMDREAQGRFCHKCTKSVHDLSSMTEDEANALLRARAGGRICVRYEHDDEGRIRFRRPAALALAAVAIAACTPHEAPRDRQVVGELVEAPVVVTPPPVVPETPATRVKMGEPPAIEPPPPTERWQHETKGEIAAMPPEPVHVLKGDIAVPNEPCDPPKPPAKPR